MSENDTVDENSSSHETGEEPEVSESEAPALAAEPAKEEAPTTREVASRLAQLAEQNRRIRERETELRRRELSIEETRQQAALFNEPEKLIEYLEQKDPTVFYKWAEKIVSTGKPDPQAETQKEIAALKQKLADREQLELNARYISWQEGVSREVLAGDYPMIQATGAESEVAKYIELYYQEHRETLDTEVAAQRVEAAIQEQAEKLLKNEKAFSKLRPILPHETPAKGPPKALNGKLTSSKPPRELTDDERWALVIEEHERVVPKRP